MLMTDIASLPLSEEDENVSRSLKKLKEKKEQLKEEKEGLEKEIEEMRALKSQLQGMQNVQILK